MRTFDEPYFIVFALAPNLMQRAAWGQNPSLLAPDNILDRGVFKAETVNEFSTRHAILEFPVSVDPSESSEFLRTQTDTDVNSYSVAGQQTDAKESFWKALNDLPEEYRTVILLRQQMDLTFPEIAERMLVSTETAQSLWSQALVALGEKLEVRE